MMPTIQRFTYILNKVVQLVPFITLGSFSIGNVDKYVPAIIFEIRSCIDSAMANSESTRAIQVYKNCVHDRKSRGVLGFGSCFLRVLKNWAFNYVVTSQFLHYYASCTNNSELEKSCYYFEELQIFSEDTQPSGVDMLLKWFNNYKFLKESIGR